MRKSEEKNKFKMIRLESVQKEKKMKMKKKQILLNENKDKMYCLVR